jgi:Rrf2 family protein
VRVTAKVDYALRALAELARAGPGPTKGEALAHAQDISLKFLENIMLELKHAGLVETRRGAEGGYSLARPPERITLADVIRALEGPLANVRGIPPQDLAYDGPAVLLRDLWVAVRANLRAVLEHVTLDHLRRGELPTEVHALLADPDAWAGRR